MTLREKVAQGVLAVLVIVLAGINIYDWAMAGKRVRRLDEATETRRAVEMREGVARVSRDPASHQKEIARLFHRVFYDEGSTWRSNRWLGIPTQQNPNDVWIIPELIAEIEPDYIVETGTAAGGSAVLWATILEQVNPSGKVITVDIGDFAAEARALPIAQRRVEFLIGSSTAPEIVSRIRKSVSGKKVLVILDSDHSKTHVLEELRLYAPLVSPGSYLVVQDTHINGNPVAPDSGPGPAEAIAEFLPANREFVVDRTRERLMFTMHPGGYLRRVT